MDRFQENKILLSPPQIIILSCLANLSEKENIADLEQFSSGKGSTFFRDI